MPYVFYIPTGTSSTEVRIKTHSYSNTFSGNTGKGLHLSAGYLKQEIKKLQKELQMHPRRIDIKIKIMELQKQLKKYTKNKK